MDCQPLRGNKSKSILTRPGYNWWTKMASRLQPPIAAAPSPPLMAHEGVHSEADCSLREVVTQASHVPHGSLGCLEGVHLAVPGEFWPTCPCVVRQWQGGGGGLLQEWNFSRNWPVSKRTIHPWRSWDLWKSRTATRCRRRGSAPAAEMWWPRKSTECQPNWHNSWFRTNPNSGNLFRSC